MFRVCTMGLSVAAVAEAAVDPIVADDKAVLGAAAALKSSLCCQVSHTQAGRSSACFLCGCRIRESQLPDKSAENTARDKAQNGAQ